MKRLVVGLFVVVILALTGGPAAAGSLYLVYDSGGGQDVIQSAMTMLGFSFDVRNAANPVSAADLSSGNYAAVIVGWSSGGYDMSGLDSSVLTAGITGNKLLTGHDADFHTYYGVTAAATFMERAVLFAGGSPGNPGILAFPVYAADPFSYLPSAWGISASDGYAYENITGITAAGTASGLYSGLTLASLSNWGNSYHAGFSAWGSGFNVFELGTEGVTEYNVTIGTTVTPIPGVPDPGATLLLFGMGIAGLAAFRRWRG